MMEKFDEDRREWERSHRESFLGRYGGGVGTGVSMQVDLVSPVGVYDMIQDPSTFNLMKLGYVPALNFAGASLVGMAVGEKITFTHRVLHSVDMTYRFYKGAAVAAGRGIVGFARWSPYILGGLGLADVGVRGHESALASGLGWIFDQIDPWGISGFTMK